MVVVIGGNNIMEALEKIYLHPDIGDKEFIKPWLRKPFNENSIEYIRTDAFIEKATSYIQQHWIWNTKIIEDFKKYMEG